MRGKLLAIGKGCITLQLFQDASLAELEGKDLEIEIKPYRANRSLSANAYYWSLTNKLASALHISNNFMHNLLLQRYGTFEEIDGSLVFVDIPVDGEDKIMESTDIHLKPTGARTGEYIECFLIKGSHRYNTKEMTRLIEGVQSEAKDLGIETRTPAELEEIMRLYEQNIRRKNNDTIRD